MSASGRVTWSSPVQGEPAQEMARRRAVDVLIRVDRDRGLVPVDPLAVDDAVADRPPHRQPSLAQGRRARSRSRPREVVELDVYSGEIEDLASCTALAGMPTNPLLGESAFIGASTKWLRESVSLDQFAGHQISIGFRLATDCASNTTPFVDPVIWHVDNLRVTGDTSAP